MGCKYCNVEKNPYKWGLHCCGFLVTLKSNAECYSVHCCKIQIRVSRILVKSINQKRFWQNWIFGSKRTFQQCKQWVVIKHTNQHKLTQTNTNQHKPTQTSQNEVKWGQRSFWGQTRPLQAVWAGLCVFCIYCSLSIVRSDTGDQTSQT